MIKLKPMLAMVWIVSSLLTISHAKDKAAAAPGLSPPRVVYAVPGYFFPHFTNISEVQVTFSATVIGVKSNNLTVNDSRALKVIGEGAGPYTFTGYVLPSTGSVQFALSSGKIKRDPSLAAFQGFSWTAM